MARRRKAKKTVTRRKRSSSRRYVGTVSVNESLSMIGGAIASRFIANALGKMFPAIVSSPINKAVTQAALGFAAKPLLGALGIKNPMIDAAGKGMIIAGGYEAMRVVAPKVLGATEDGDVIVVSGNEISEINGMDELGGMDEIGNDDISEINGYFED
jgi:hypothetical protein